MISAQTKILESAMGVISSGNAVVDNKVLAAIRDVLDFSLRAHLTHDRPEGDMTTLTERAAVKLARALGGSA